MFHAFALIHDDVMDDSPTRRGRPTIHRALAERHLPGRTAEVARRFGLGAAILIGDLALSWSDELIHAAGLSPGQMAAVLPLIDTMRGELMHGQYLDLAATGDLTVGTDRVLEIIRYKTAKYTIERPLHVGAVLTNADPGLHNALSTYALPTGEAFQLRDDLLGIFGDPAATGKSNLDDLRVGKATMLMALACERAEPAQLATLHALVGCADLNQDHARQIQNILEATGSRDVVENMIQARRIQAHQALTQAPFPPAAATVLRQMADAAATRNA
jgi:geranylgeranyl diphosphate synthase type I